MKVKLEIELDLPDNPYSYFHKEELNQLLFDEYINYCNVSHLKDALFLMTEIPNKEKDLNIHVCIDSHKIWAKICDNAKWRIISVGENTTI